jgi:hypothetical protein
MAKVAVVKKEHEDKPRRISATRCEEVQGRLLIYDGDTKVGDFRLDKVEDWSLESE